MYIKLSCTLLVVVVNKSAPSYYIVCRSRANLRDLHSSPGRSILNMNQLLAINEKTLQVGERSPGKRAIKSLHGEIEIPRTDFPKFDSSVSESTLLNVRPSPD